MKAQTEVITMERLKQVWSDDRDAALSEAKSILAREPEWMPVRSERFCGKWVVAMVPRADSGAEAADAKRPGRIDLEQAHQKAA